MLLNKHDVMKYDRFSFNCFEVHLINFYLIYLTVHRQ